MQKGLIIAAFFVLNSAAAFPQQSTVVSTSVVAATDPSVRTTEGRTAVEFRLVNKVESAVIAWQVTLDYTLSDGSIHRFGALRDGYPAGTEMMRGRNSPVVSGLGESPQTIRLAVPEGRQITSVRPTLDLVVFDDTTWLGDAKVAMLVFDQRRRDEAAWTLIGDAMRLGVAARGAAGLRRALAHLNRSDQEDFDHLDKIVVRKNLERTLNQDPAIKATPDDFLRIWVARASERQDAAASQRTSKGPRRAK